MLLIVFSLCITNSVYAEESGNILEFKIESRASFAGGENTPFWLVNNIQGLGSPKFNNGWVRASAIKNIDSQKKFSWGAGVDLVGGWNLISPFRIQQLFGEIKYRRLWIMAGSREMWGFYNNRHLSSGDLFLSGNAMPIPQFRIGTYDFAPFWGTNGWFSVKAYLAYGKFTDSKWQKDWVAYGSNRTSGVLFCSRGLWFRFGKESDFPITADIGVEMGTQFAGTVYKDGKVLRMPHKFVDWVKAFIPVPGNSDTLMEEQTNVQGNMTGEYTISLSYVPNSDWRFRAYFEHYFEDHSQMFLEYGPWKDGLWGLEISFPKNRFVNSLVYEFITTKDQTGAVNHDWTPEVPSQVSGRDNYFNHYLYNAWQNWGMTMGTPLAISPIYNKNHILTIYNTRFLAHHIGLKGNPLDNLSWRVLLTFSRNWGTYWLPLEEVMNNFSGLVEISYSPQNWKGFFANGALAWDHGPLLGNNFGGMISFGFQGAFFFHK